MRLSLCRPRCGEGNQPPSRDAQFRAYPIPYSFSVWAGQTEETWALSGVNGHDSASQHHSSGGLGRKQSANKASSPFQLMSLEHSLPFAAALGEEVPKRQLRDSTALAISPARHPLKTSIYVFRLTWMFLWICKRGLPSRVDDALLTDHGDFSCPRAVRAVRCMAKWAQRLAYDLPAPENR